MVPLLSPLAATIVGVLMFALCKDATLKEIGRALMWVGLFWLVHEAGGAGKLLGR